MKKKIVSVIITIIILVSCVYYFLEYLETTDKVDSVVDGVVYVHFIDVGQGDSIFIKYGDVDVLIDGGKNNDTVVKYLESLDVDDIELLVATHPHEDHMGGLDEVINRFPVKKILNSVREEETKTNENFKQAIRDNKIVTLYPEQGEVFEFGDLAFFVLSDKNKEYKDTNNYSIVLKMVYGDTSFIFTGDAEDKEEQDILASHLNLKADVLKIGHHGSASSTTAKFLFAVKPDYAVISVGTGNRYGHPDNIVIDRLNLNDVATMRTDELGTIIFTTDGTILSFTTAGVNNE